MIGIESDDGESPSRRGRTRLTILGLIAGEMDILGTIC
jgi:hypothetical protein